MLGSDVLARVELALLVDDNYFCAVRSGSPGSDCCCPASKVLFPSWAGGPRRAGWGALGRGAGRGGAGAVIADTRDQTSGCEHFLGK